MATAGQVVLLIDRAAGLENMGKLNFNDCLQIVDFYHAMEHAGQVLDVLIGKSHPEYQKRQRTWAKRLLKDKVAALIKETRQECSGRPQEQAVEEALGYFIGSGVVEAGCKTVMGGRCKQSGMFWSKAGAENILALRCIYSSRRLDEFWKSRLNAHAALNDPLPLAA